MMAKNRPVRLNRRWWRNEPKKLVVMKSEKNINFVKRLRDA
jgi:hypothetical protein